MLTIWKISENIFVLTELSEEKQLMTQIKMKMKITRDLQSEIIAIINRSNLSSNLRDVGRYIRVDVKKNS